METKEIRDLVTEELARKNKELAEELFRLRLRHASGQLEATSALGRTKKDIARIKTILREREAR